MKRLATLLVASVLGLVLCTTSASAEVKYSKQKVVYHINGDNAKQQAGALRNVQNHINAVGAEHLDLKVVLHGNGVSLLLLPEALGEVSKMKAANATETMQAKVDGLKNQGVQFQICANTLNGRKISLEDHLYNADKADVVPSGVAHLAHLQAMGYTYIKP